ncbi:MAG TPA: hypothetical protein DC013_09480 [Ruminococcaceae bacterium]|jgi:hypothetical protein|nr:hypothetical protein [Oscillospiraceae bacterium]
MDQEKEKKQPAREDGGTEQEKTADQAAQPEENQQNASPAPETSAEKPAAPAPEADENAEEEPDGGQEPEKPGKKRFFQTTRFRRGGVSAVFTAGFLAIIILLNVIVSILGDRFPSMNVDLSTGNSNTLSEQAKKAVDAAKLPTTITIIGTEADVKSDSLLSDYGIKYSQVATLADKIHERNPKIGVEYVDLDKNPTFASKYAGQNLTTGSVVVATERRFRVLQISDLFDQQTDYSTGAAVSYSKVDGALASAVSQTNSEKLPVVAFATGHDEMYDTTAFQSVLKNGNFETVSFNLLTEKVPENAQMVVLAAPASDYTEDELKKLDGFLSDTKLASDRSLFLTFYPGQKALPNLSAFLKEWGMAVPAATMVVESDSTKVAQSDATFILTQTGVDSAVDLGAGTSAYENVTMPQSSPVNLLFSSQDGVTTHALAASYDSSYLVDEKTAQNQQASPKKASHTTMALAQRPMTVNGKSYSQNVVVAGSSPMFANGVINASVYGNGKYVTDIARYVTGSSNNDTGVAVTPVETNPVDINLSQAASNILGVGVFTLLIPLAVLAAGIVVYLKRRHL